MYAQKLDLRGKNTERVLILRNLTDLYYTYLRYISQTHHLMTSREYISTTLFLSILKQAGF